MTDASKSEPTFNHSETVTSSKINMKTNRNSKGKSPCNVHSESEHPFLDVLRSEVAKYCMQSFGHYQLYIRVRQVASKDVPTKQSKAIRLTVMFDHYGSKPIIADCGPEYHTPAHEGPGLATGRIVIMRGNRNIFLEDFLSKHFPVKERPQRCAHSDMYNWWSDNGKTFNWNGLPLEIKELVIFNCMTEIPAFATEWGATSYSVTLPRSSAVLPRGPRYSPRPKMNPHRQPYEITDKFNYSDSLLQTSYQIRCIALRLAIKGAPYPYHEGLALSVSCGYQITERINTLDHYRQNLLPDGAQMDKKSTARAKAYKYHPRIFPQFAQYATYAQGIRKLVLNLEYPEVCGFFKIPISAYEDFFSYPISYATYETLKRLPNLNTVVVVMPHPELEASWSASSLSRNGNYCSRLLGRCVYERVVETLAFVPNVEMTRLLDDEEEARFQELRAASKQATSQAQEDDGGIDIESVVYHEPQLASEVIPFAYPWGPWGWTDAWPPKCKCEVKCADITQDYWL